MIHVQRKYELFGEFLRENRKKHHRSARGFCTTVDLGISYPQYSRYEAGEQLPSLEQVLKIADALEAPVMDAVQAWNLAQISDADARTRFREQWRLSKASESRPVEGPGHPGAQGGLKEAMALDDVIVFNRAHLRLFQSDPAYRDIFTAVNCANGWATVSAIAQALHIAPERLRPMLLALNDHGVIDLDGDYCKTSKSNFYFPDDADFFEIRNRNFIYEAQSILANLKAQDVATKRSYRSLLTRDLSHAQLLAVIEKLDLVMAQVLEMEHYADSERIYSVCALVGPRYSRVRAEPFRTRAPSPAVDAHP